MLKSIIAFGLSRRTIVVLGVVVFLVSGFIAFQKLSIEAYPNPAPVILEITAQAPGLTTEEMERYYTIPMEVGLYPTPGIANIRSTSFYGLTFLRVTFKYGVDYRQALYDTNVNISQNINLPGNQVPSIQQSSLVGEVYRYQVTGPEHTGLTNLRTIQDWVVTRRLYTVPGVVQVNSFGGTTKQFNVDVDLPKLEIYSVTIPQIITALGNANINVGGREIDVGEQSVNIRGVGLFDDGGNEDLLQGHKVEDIENVVIAQVNTLPVRIKDVAKVYVGYTPRLGMAGIQHEDDAALSIVVMHRLKHTNDVVPAIEREVEKMNTDGTLPPGVKVVSYYDRMALVDVTTHTVLHNLIFGCLLVFFIQWVFLGDLRSAIVVAANIPIALFFAIIVLVVRDEDANLLSVGAVDFGIIVDSAVILVENIFRNFQAPEMDRRTVLNHLAEGQFGSDPTSAQNVDNSAAWTDRLRLIFISALQVDKAIFFSTLITVAAFIPLFTMQGVEGQIFNPMAKTYGYALAGALLSTFTVTPVLASLLLPAHIEETETFVVRFLRQIYSPILRRALDNRRATVAIGLGVLAFVGLLSTRLGSEFLPHLEEGNFWIRAQMPLTSGLNSGRPHVHKMREILLSHPEIVTVTSQHGRPDNGSDPSPFSNVELFATFKPFDQWPAGMDKEKLTHILQKEFEDAFPGVTTNFSQYIQDNIEEAISGIKGANSIKLFGHDLDKLEQYAEAIKNEMKQVRGIEDLGIFHVQGQPNLNIFIDREHTARMGLNTGDVNTVVQAALAGTTATTLLEGDRAWNVVVRLAPEYRNTLDKIGEVKVAGGNNGNAYIPLKELAKISLDTGPSYIYHEGMTRFIAIKFSVRGRDLGSTVAEAQERIARAVPLPNGYRITWAGEFEDLQLAKERLMVIIPISFGLIFVLLYGLFNSLRDSLLALTGIPFAVAGGIVALYVTGMDFSVSAAIGFVSLFGVSVMDGILMITYYNQVRRGGMHVLEAMYHAAEQRMRPMLMTALSACIGLFPAAISTAIGSQVQRPLATVVVGGMLIGPVMLLLVVPALRMMFLGGDDHEEEHSTPTAPAPEGASAP